MNTQDLIDEYRKWIEAQGVMPYESADEVLALLIARRDKLNEQIAWVADFMARWDRLHTGERP